MRLRPKLLLLLGVLLLPLALQSGQQTATPPAQEESKPATKSKDDSEFTFRKEVEEVVLYATVIDNDQRIVNTLTRDAFTVFEDGRPQLITSFRREDIPVSLGIVIDNSGSMKRSRTAVNQATVNLIKASNAKGQA